jgi:hypothetical protein
LKINTINSKGGIENKCHNIDSINSINPIKSTNSEGDIEYQIHEFYKFNKFQGRY